MGADERIFRNLAVSNARLVHIPWPAFTQQDDMVSYAKRISDEIKEDDPILLGVSFGGMLATEITKIRPVQKTIIVSSCKTIKEFPGYAVFLKGLLATQLIPSFIFRLPNPVLYHAFGTENKEERKLLRDILLSSDPKFMKWALKAVALWKNDTYDPAIIHIHGRKDRVLLPRPVHATHWFDDGGHLIIYNRAEHISRIIENELNDTDHNYKNTRRANDSGSHRPGSLPV